MRPFNSQLPLTLIASAILLATATPSFSADRQAETQLPALQIEAQKNSTASSHTSSTVSEIQGQDLEQNLVRNLDDLVRFEPGVEATQDSRFGISSINIRGLDGDRVKIAVDGVDQANAYGPTSTYLRTGRNTVDMESLEKVTIAKGGDVISGSGALGGVVKYQTKEPSSFLAAQGDDNFVSYKGGYRSAMDQFSETLTLVNRTGKLETLFLYTRRDGHETENYLGDAGSDKTLGATRRFVDPADNKSDNFLVKAQYQLDEMNRIGVVAESYDADSTSDLYSESATNDLNRADDNSNRQRIGVFWESQEATSAYDKMKWQLDYQETKTTNKTFRESSTRTRLVNRFYDESSVNLRGDLVKNLNNQQVRYGINYKDISLENLNKDNTMGTSRFSPLADANIIGAYVEDAINVSDRLTLTPALRYDHYQYRTKSDQYVDAFPRSDNEALTAQLGAEFELTPVYSFYGKSGTGFRAPDLDDLYYYYDAGRGYAIVPNPALESETSVFLEAGVRAQTDYSSAEFTLFYNKYKDFIESDVSTGSTTAHPFGEFTTKNLNRVRIKGAEFKGSLNLSKLVGGAADSWVLNTAIAYAEGKDLQKNQPVDSVAPLSAVVGLGYDAPSSTWGGKLNLTLNRGKDKADITSSNQWLATKSYRVVDLTAYYKPSETITLNAGVFNLFDEEYRKWSDVRKLSNKSTSLERYSRAGRNFGVDVTLAF